jgi:hypothetical protein
MTRSEAVAQFVDRFIADATRACMTSLICRDADCDFDDAAESIAEYHGEQRARMILLVEAALIERDRN